MVAFVILNYNNYDDTKICIDSLLKISGGEHKIIVVDNASADGSYARLIETYESAEDVKFIANSANLGFSKGNNVGCKYAVENYDVDFLCVINNDTYIEDAEFCNKLYKIYDETLFDILAPCVWNTRKNYNQNPFYCPKDEEELRREIKNIKFNSKFLKLGAIPYYVVRKMRGGTVTGKTVSGAACIFSKRYIDRYDEVFIEKTFMYCEEAFLYRRMINDDLTVVYNNDVVVYHSDAKTTRKLNKSRKKKWTFQCQNILKADEILLKYITEEENKKQ